MVRRKKEPEVALVQINPHYCEYIVEKLSEGAGDFVDSNKSS